MGNAFLDKQEKKNILSREATQATIRQFMFDTAQIVLHREFGWGYERIKRFSELWFECYDEFFGAVETPKSFVNDERDVYRKHLDEAIADILKDNQQMIPFSERYPYATNVSYERKKK